LIAKCLESGLGDDGAVHPAGIGDGHPTIRSDEFDKSVAFGDEFRISPGVGRHIGRGSARFFAQVDRTHPAVLLEDVDLSFVSESLFQNRTGFAKHQFVMQRMNMAESDCFTPVQNMLNYS
jgi:hypothetical protein